jgi:hypothetical protein
LCLFVFEINVLFGETACVVKWSEFLATQRRCIVSCEVRTDFLYVMLKRVDRLFGLVVRVPNYTTEMDCASCEVRPEFIYVM